MLSHGKTQRKKEGGENPRPDCNQFEGQQPCFIDSSPASKECWFCNQALPIIKPGEAEAHPEGSSHPEFPSGVFKCLRPSSKQFTEEFRDDRASFTGEAPVGSWREVQVAHVHFWITPEAWGKSMNISTWKLRAELWLEAPLSAVPQQFLRLGAGWWLLDLPIPGPIKAWLPGHLT